MKKYQQLLLAILSLVSFSCLLFYRHEYNKLRYVLQVLNFFGTPGESTSPALCNRSSETSSKFLPTPVDPLGAWQRISNSLYIYSAYWEKNEDKEHIVALAVGVLDENLNYGCYLYYNTHPKTRTGEFSFSGLPHKSSGKSRTKGFVFYCEPDIKGPTPVGVVFFKTSANESSQGFLPVLNLKLDVAPADSTGICIMPSPFSSFNKSTYLEFLSFHKIIGVNNFIVYGGNDQYNLLYSIQQDPSHNIELSIMRWNYPFFEDNELMKVIAENDCKIRTRGLFENVLILEWSKYFVPRNDIKIGKLLNYLDKYNKTSKFQFLTLLFCSEYEDNIKSNLTSPYVFRKTRYAFPKVDILVPLYRPNTKTSNAQKVSKKIVAVQWYASCHDFKIKSGEKKNIKVDNTIYMYQNKFLNSKLLRL